jgi:hypothetical protein
MSVYTIIVIRNSFVCGQYSFIAAFQQMFAFMLSLFQDSLKFKERLLIYFDGNS